MKGFRVGVITLLSDAGDVKNAVDSSVPAEVESVSDGLSLAFSGREGHGTGAAPAGKLGL